MDYITKTFLDCYLDAVMGLQASLKKAATPKQNSWDDPLFWENSAIEWARQAVQNYRHLEREFQNAAK